MGFATAKVLACASSTFHIILACRSLEKAAAAVAEIEAAGPQGSVSTVQLDVTDENSINEAAAVVERTFGRLDVLINNAGAGGTDPDLKTRFETCLAANVTGPALVSDAFRSLLFKSLNPYSIYIGTGAWSLVKNATQQKPAHASVRKTDAYLVSKAALNMLAMQDWAENGPRGLKVFVFSPGFVRSNLRGTSEEARSGWGKAGNPEVAGEAILGIIQGKRDADVGCLMDKDGVHPW